MNNDLTKLSDKELSDKKTEIASVSTFLMRKLATAKFRYDKLKGKRRTNPVILLDYQKEIECLTKNQKIIDEYNLVLIDEYNRRC